MKKVILSLAIAASVLTACKSGNKEKVDTKEAVKVEVVSDLNNADITSSLITWKGTKPTGAHNGTIMLKEGSLNVSAGKLIGGSFVIDMPSMKNLDLDAEGSAKIIGHLTSPDFFNIAAFPTSKFVITSVADVEERLAVTGNLTIKDVTKSITIPAMLMTKEGITTFKSEKFNVDRADFNVKYASKKFFDNLKDKFIDDMIEFSFTVKTKA
jgi:hypothetical protein